MRIRDEKGLESEGTKDIDAEKEDTFLSLNKTKERNGSRRKEANLHEYWLQRWCESEQLQYWFMMIWDRHSYVLRLLNWFNYDCIIKFRQDIGLVIEKSIFCRE